MRILVVGSGGREHALVWKLKQEAEVICAPGNAGIAEEVECLPIAATDIASLLLIALERQVDLVVVGPEDPLVLGLADALRSQGIPVFGPGEAGARLEASKAFSKDLMFKGGVPTARFVSFDDPLRASEYARERYGLGRPIVVKASGNALGKGVIVPSGLDEALAAIDELSAMGAAGETLVLEDHLHGREFSLLTLVSGEEIFSLPVSQDHKRIGNGDTGPNTGGMGTFAPVPSISDSLVRETEDRVVRPILKQLLAEGIDYRGVLFSGLMFDGDELNCLEYNVRFGDPETQSVMMLLGEGFAEALLRCANGQGISPMVISDQSAVTVVIASGGYPASSDKGKVITLGDMPEGVKIFHAGTKLDGDQLVTNGGRVLGVTGVGASLDIAKSRAYAGVSQVCFEGMQFRADIG